MKTGFTLMEIIVVVAIATLLLVAAGSVIVTEINLHQTQSMQADLEENLATTLNLVQKIGSEALAILPNHIFAGKTYATGQNTLVLALPAFTASGQVITNETDYAVFYLDPIDRTKLYVEFDISALSARNGTKKIMSDAINQIQFQYNNADATKANLITITTSLLKQAGVKILHANGTTTILLRNR